MVYPQMNHIERPEGIIISSAIQVDVDGDKRCDNHRINIGADQ